MNGSLQLRPDSNHRRGNSVTAVLASLRSNRFSVLISLGVTLLGLAAYGAIHFTHKLRSAFVFLDTVEARTLDARFQFRGPVPPDSRIVIAAIDQKTVDRLGWPFSRSNYVPMLRALKRAGAKVVVFDMDFPFADPSSSARVLAGLEKVYQDNRKSQASDAFLKRLRELEAQSDSDAQFAAAIQEAGNVVLGHFFFTNRDEARYMDPEQIKAYAEILSFQTYPQVLKRKSASSYPFHLETPEAIGVEPNLKIFADAAESYGAFNFEADNDGAYRTAPLIFQYKDPSGAENFYPSVDIEAARLYLGAGPQETKLWFNSNGPELIEIGTKKIYPDVSGSVFINYAGPAQTYPYYSMADIAEGLIPNSAFGGKIVVVGATATGLGDMRPTPFAKQGYPGVEIHANVLDNILNEHFLHRAFSEEITDLLVLLFCGLVMGMLFVVVPPLTATLLFVGALLILGTFVYFNFSVQARWLSLVLPGGTLAMNYLGVVSYRVLFEERQKRRVRGAFSQYVAPGFITQILKDPGGLKLGGEKVDLTVMFCDIRGFTTMAEQLTPEELVELLKDYLTAMTDIIFKNRGTLDKYIGDAVMAFWGRPFLDLPNHAEAACRAALDMTIRLGELNAAWTKLGRPALTIGIGINSGPMMVGNMGSLRRFNYTVMGDHVNLGSRVEGLTKEYGTQIILTEGTYQQVGAAFVVRELDLIRVKGKSQPVTIYELLAPAEQRDRYRELLDDFQCGLAEYKLGNWEAAAEIFEGLASKYPADGPTQVFLDRSRRFAADPPQGSWEGVYTMTTK